MKQIVRARSASVKPRFPTDEELLNADKFASHEEFWRDHWARQGCSPESTEDWITKHGQRSGEHRREWWEDRDADPVLTRDLGDVWEDGDGKIAWRIEGVMAESSTSLLVGVPESFKSWTAYHIGLTVATGKPLFGRYATVPGPVLLYQLERPQADHERRIRLFYESMERAFPEFADIAISDVPFHHRRSPLLTLDRQKTVDFLRHEIKDRKPALVIFDSLLAAFPGDENSPEWVAHIKGTVSKLQDAHPSAMMFIHHMRKLSSEAALNDPLEMIRGHSSLRQFPDHVYHLKRRSPLSTEVTFCVIKQSLGPAVHPVVLRFNGPESPAGTGFEDLGTADDPTARSGATKVLVELLTKVPNRTMSRQEILPPMAEAGFNEDQVDRAIGTLKSARRIEKGKVGKAVTVTLVEKEGK